MSCVRKKVQGHTKTLGFLLTSVEDRRKEDVPSQPRKRERGHVSCLWPQSEAAEGHGAESMHRLLGRAPETVHMEVLSCALLAGKQC